MPVRIDCRSALFCKSQLVGRIIIFCITFVGFASNHAVRKGFSNVKVNIAAPYCDEEKYVICSAERNGTVIDYCCNIRKEHLCLLSTDLNTEDKSYHNLTLCDAWFGDQDDTTKALGLFDTLFLFCYAAGLFVAGIIEDRVNLRCAIVLGMLTSGLCAIMFATLGFLKCHALYLFAAVWALNGLAQSTGWPGFIAVMGKWFPKSSRGAVIGLWGGNSSVGNIVGASLVLLALSVTKTRAYPSGTGDWRVAMMVPSVLIIFVAVLVFIFVVPSPKLAGFDVGIENEHGPSAGSNSATQPDLVDRTTPLLSPCDATPTSRLDGEIDGEISSAVEHPELPKTTIPAPANSESILSHGHKRNSEHKPKASDNV